MWECGLDWSDSEEGQKVGFCEYDNELSGSIQFFDQLSGYQDLKKSPVQRSYLYLVGLV
jgi:hypothetical protein